MGWKKKNSDNIVKHKRYSNDAWHGRCFEVLSASCVVLWGVFVQPRKTKCPTAFEVLKVYPAQETKSLLRPPERNLSFSL